MSVATNHYTADALLLPALKRRGMLPNTSETLADTDYYALADDELQSYIVPILIKAAEEYLIYTEETSLTAGDDTYPIPYRAAGGKIRDIWLSNGNTTSYKQLQRIETERIGDYSASGSPVGYRFEGANIIIMPSPTTGGSIRVKYLMMPSRLVAATACAKVVTVTHATKTITLAATPAAFVTGELLDVVRQKPGFDTLTIDNPVTVSGTTLTFTNALNTDIAVGDYVCLAGESPIPQIPAALHPLLAQRVVYRSLEALGDPKAAGALAGCQELERLSLSLLSPRSDGSSRAVVNRYGPGFRHNWRFR